MNAPVHKFVVVPKRETDRRTLAQQRDPDQVVRRPVVKNANRTLNLLWQLADDCLAPNIIHGNAPARGSPAHPPCLQPSRRLLDRIPAASFPIIALKASDQIILLPRPFLPSGRCGCDPPTSFVTPNTKTSTKSSAHIQTSNSNS